MEESRNSLHPFSFESFGQPDNGQGKTERKRSENVMEEEAEIDIKSFKKMRKSQTDIERKEVRVKEIKEDRLRKERQAERDKENEKKKRERERERISENEN